MLSMEVAVVPCIGVSRPFIEIAVTFTTGITVVPTIKVAVVPSIGAADVPLLGSPCPPLLLPS